MFYPFKILKEDPFKNVNFLVSITILMFFLAYVSKVSISMTQRKYLRNVKYSFIFFEVVSNKNTFTKNFLLDMGKKKAEKTNILTLSFF